MGKFKFPALIDDGRPSFQIQVVLERLDQREKCIIKPDGPVI